MSAHAPITIGPANAEQAVGAGWEWVRDQARRLGVPLLGTRRKQLVSATAFLSALEHDAVTAEPRRDDGVDPAAEVRRRLGVRRASHYQSAGTRADRADSEVRRAIAPEPAPSGGRK